MDDRLREQETLLWLALARGPAVSASLLAGLARGDGRLAQLFESPPAVCPDAPAPTLFHYLRAPDWAGAERDLHWLSGASGQLVLYTDPSYPALLRNICNPPPVLFLRGDSAALNLRQIAVVGTRKPTADGRRQAREIAAALAQLDIGVTSGLALGIDSQAHAGALDAGGRTIAVLGCGPDHVYPRHNAGLAEKIAQRGAVVSEFGVGTGPLAVNFPRRNRIISGLALGTLVVEAALRSGSLITAACAAAQGREVFAMPGSIRNPLTRGCHHLINQGARLVTEVGDILEEIRELADCRARAAPVTTQARLDDTGLDENARLLIDCMGFGPVATDELVDQTGLAAGITASLLSRLEISGLIEILPGGRVIRRQSKGCK